MRPRFPPLPTTLAHAVELHVLGRVTEPSAKRKADLAEAEARLEVNPDDVDALMLRGAVLVAQDHDEEAIRVLVAPAVVDQRRGWAGSIARVRFESSGPISA